MALEIRVDKILDTNGYIERNHIHEDSILKFVPSKEIENDYTLMVNNKLTSQHFTKHEIGKLLKNFKYTEHKN